MAAYETNLQQQADQKHEALIHEALDAQAVVKQHAQAQFDIMEQQVIDKSNSLAQQHELARMRDIELQHLQLRLQEAEAAAKIATSTDETSSAAQTQADPPTPTTKETTTEASATLLIQQLQPYTQPTRPASPSIHEPELLFQEDEDTGTTSSPPPAERLATESPTPTSASMEGTTYPPMHHGTTVPHSMPSSAGSQIQRGREHAPTISAKPDSSPKPASPTSASRVIRQNLTPSLADSPLQDHTTGVKKFKSGVTNRPDHMQGLAQDVSKQFEPLKGDPHYEPPSFPAD